MDTILVTGGAGFIGCNFVRLALSQTKFRVVVLDKLTYAGNLCSLESVAQNPRFAFMEGDISDRNCVDAIFRQHRPLWVVNFAAETHVDRSIDDPRPFVNTNIVGTSELLEASRRHWMGLDASARSAFRFLHISTDEVYGTLGATGLFEETTPYAPNSPYAASKAGSDHLVRAYYETYGLPVIITNCSNNYGPFQFPEKLIPLMLLNGTKATAADLWRWRQRPRLALCGGSLPRHSGGIGKGPAGGKVQHWRQKRAYQPPDCGAHLCEPEEKAAGREEPCFAEEGHRQL